MVGRRSDLTSVDLFAGCGGLTRGLEDAGFRCVAFNEINDDAAGSFEANFREAKRFGGDISELTNKEVRKELLPLLGGVGQLDLLCGGPPCQEYARGQSRRSQKVETKDVPQSYLFEEMVRLIELLEPRVFLFENVEGLLTAKWTKWERSRKGEVFRRVWKTFEKLEKYEIQPTLIHAYNFGVPQNRPRVMIMGVREDVYSTCGYEKVEFNPRQRRFQKNGKETYSKVLRNNGGLFPLGNERDFPDMFDALDDLDFKGWTQDKPKHRKKPKTEFQRDMRKNLGDNWRKQELLDHEFSDHTDLIRERFQHMITHQVPMKECPPHLQTEKNSQKFTPKRWNGGTPTFTCQSIPDDVCHYSEPRTFSVREWARLQTFLDDHIFKGPRTTGGWRRSGKPKEGDFRRECPKYTQIGNAVPPYMAQTIGERIATIISGRLSTTSHEQGSKPNSPEFP